MSGFCDTKREILRFLDQNGIPYEAHEHERAFTIGDCLKMPFSDENVTICKNILLCNRQQTAFYLMLLKPLTPFRTAVVSKALGVSRLSFAPEDALMELLHLSSGSVSPLGLYYDQEHRITLCYERAVRDTPRIAFHPCDNSATVVFTQSVFGSVLYRCWAYAPQRWIYRRRRGMLPYLRNVAHNDFLFCLCKGREEKACVSFVSKVLTSPCLSVRTRCIKTAFPCMNSGLSATRSLLSCRRSIILT